MWQINSPKSLQKWVTRELLEEVIRNPDEILYDSITGRYVAVKWKAT